MPALMIALGIVTVFFSLVSLLALSEVITNTLPKMIMKERYRRKAMKDHDNKARKEYSVCCKRIL